MCAHEAGHVVKETLFLREDCKSLGFQRNTSAEDVDSYFLCAYDLFMICCMMAVRSVQSLPLDLSDSESLCSQEPDCTCQPW